MCIRHGVCRAIVFMLLLSNCLYGEKVGIFSKTGAFNKDQESVVKVPQGVVALSGNIPISSDSTASVENSTSIFFMVDNSRSMEFTGRDPLMNRFRLISKIVDTLAANPDKFPDIECGLGVFGTNLYYDKNNSPLLEELPNDFNGAFLPLLNLSHRYGDTIQKSGKEIIQDLVEIYLDSLHIYPKVGSIGEWWVSDTTDYFKYNDGFGEKFYHNSVKMVDSIYSLVSAPHWSWNTGTEIDYGFRAAVEAMKRSRNPKENQFIIFLSDGEGGNLDCQNGKMNGDQDLIPTTFTIFFTPEGTAPELIKEMADSIKCNGYSSSNLEYTNLVAYNNTTANALLEYVMDSIITIFEAKTTTEPNTISINGKSSSTWEKESGNFVYANPFPLTGILTPFDFSLKLSTYKDSLVTSDSILTVKIDTEFTFNSSIEIDENVDEQALSGTISWWDREISIGNMDSVLNETDKENQIDFHIDPLESDYRYSEVSLLVFTKSSKDSLEISLSKMSDTLFSTTLLLDALSEVDREDNKITPDKEDTIFFLFRNSENNRLPLDTLLRSIPYAQSGEIYLNSAVICDENSDGKADKITIDVSGDTVLLNAGVTEFMSTLQFPPSRNIRVDHHELKGSELILLISHKDEVNTAPHKDDTVAIEKDFVISTGGIVYGKKIQLVDKMAPVVVSATLFDNLLEKEDSLHVVFSEEIQAYDSTSLFQMYQGSATYQKSFDIPENKKSFVDFKWQLKERQGEFIKEGDSLNLDVTALFSDGANIQSSSRNRKVPITIKRETIEVSVEALQFKDPKGEGFPSEIELIFNEVIPEDVRENVNDILGDYISTLPKRKLKIESINWNDKIATIKTERTVSDLISTVTSASDELSFVKLSLSPVITLKETNIIPEDKMAPVIISAVCIDSIISDTIHSLIFKFSEPLANLSEFESKLPLNFFTRGQKSEIELDFLSHSGNELLLYPSEKRDSEFWETIDSVNINHNFGISDGSCSQEAEKNRKVPFIIKRIPAPISLQLKASTVTSENEISYIVVSPLNKSALQDGEQIIGSVSILDKVGNTVISNVELIPHDGYSLIEWDGTNGQDRVSGSGTYLVIAHIEGVERTDGTILENSRLQTFVGIQK